MSIKAMNWAWQIDLIANKKLTLLCLADHADNDGVCWPGISAVVEKTGLSRRTVINFLHEFEAGGLLRQQHRKGTNGRQLSSVIELNLKAERMQIGAVVEADCGGSHDVGKDVGRNDGKGVVEHQAPDAPPGANSAPGFLVEPDAKKRDYRVQKSAITGCKKGPVSNEEPTTESKEESSEPDFRSNAKPGLKPHLPSSPQPDPMLAEDDRLARWMFSLIQTLHPSHREPNWRTWARDVRLMREVDKRDHSQIARLFRWANGDSFWRTNVLSPAKLRAKWDQLVIQRNARQHGPGASPIPAPAVDRRCAWPSVDHPHRCTHQGISSLGSHPSSPWYCAQHLDHVEELASTRHSGSVELHA